MNSKSEHSVSEEMIEIIADILETHLITCAVSRKKCEGYLTELKPDGTIDAQALPGILDGFLFDLEHEIYKEHMKNVNPSEV
jgi:hypothetical protein